MAQAVSGPTRKKKKITQGTVPNQVGVAPVLPPVSAPAAPPPVPAPAPMAPTMPSFDEQTAWMSPSYKEPNPPGVMGAGNDILAQLRRQANQPLDFENDPIIQALQGQAQQRAQLASRGALETINQRGLLNSTIAADRIAQIQQQAQTEALPQILQQAQQARQQQFQNQLSMFDVQQTLQQNQLAQQEAELRTEQQRIDRAWERVQNLGYVDNIASVALGIPAGTPSFDAQKVVEDRKLRLQMAREQIAAANARAQPSAYEQQLESAQAAALERVTNGTATAVDYELLGMRLPTTEDEVSDQGYNTALEVADLYGYIEGERAKNAALDPDEEALPDWQIRQNAINIMNENLRAGNIDSATYNALLRELNRILPPPSKSDFVYP